MDSYTAMIQHHIQSFLWYLYLLIHENLTFTNTKAHPLSFQLALRVGASQVISNILQAYRVSHRFGAISYENIRDLFYNSAISCT